MEALDAAGNFILSVLMRLDAVMAVMKRPPSELGGDL
jgi:hypothetical protein